MGGLQAQGEDRTGGTRLSPGHKGEGEPARRSEWGPHQPPLLGVFWVPSHRPSRTGSVSSSRVRQPAGEGSREWRGSVTRPSGRGGEWGGRSLRGWTGGTARDAWAPAGRAPCVVADFPGLLARGPLFVRFKRVVGGTHTWLCTRGVRPAGTHQEASSPGSPRVSPRGRLGGCFPRGLSRAGPRPRRPACVSRKPFKPLDRPPLQGFDLTSQLRRWVSPGHSRALLVPQSLPSGSVRRSCLPLPASPRRRPWSDE